MMKNLFDNECRYMSDSDLVYEISNSHEIVRQFERDIDNVKLEELFSYLTPARRKVAVAAVEMYKRLVSTPDKRKEIKESRDIFEIMQPKIGDLLNEEFWVIALDNAAKVIKVVRVSVGGIDFAPVDIRCLMKVLLDAGATRFAISHNHPSGSIKPSIEDRALTESIKKAADLLKIELLDHIIIGKNQYTSFAEEGLI